MVSTNPRRLTLPRAHAPGFSVTMTDWSQPDRGWPAYRDHGWGDFDRIPDFQPFLNPLANLHTLKSTARVIYRMRPSGTELRIERHWLRKLPNISACRSRRPEHPRSKAQDKRLMRESPTLIVRHFHDTQTGWVVNSVEGDAAAVVLDRLSDRPDWLSLTHLSVITTEGRRVKLGTALADAYALMGIEERHWLDALLGLHDNRYARFAERQARLISGAGPDRLIPDPLDEAIDRADDEAICARWLDA